MISVPVHRDLTRYRAKVVGGLTARTLACVAAAVGVSVAIGAWFWLALGVEFERVSWLAYGASVPFWALGFVRPHGMEVEAWLPLWLRHVAGPSRLTYDVRDRYRARGLVRDTWEAVAHGRRRPWERVLGRRRGIERWEPGAGGGRG